MNDDFGLRATLQTEEELQNSINNREDYLPQTVEAAVSELQSRGIEFSDEELTVIAEDMQARRELANTKPEGYGVFSNRDKNNLVKDPAAPALYTRKVIYVFTVLFSVVFGSIMLAINVSKTPNRSKAILVVLAGLAYTIVLVAIAQKLHLGQGFTIITSVMGAYLMEMLFWDRYIGNSTLYRAKPYWLPLTIALVIVALILLAATFLKS